MMRLKTFRAGDVDQTASRIIIVHSILGHFICAEKGRACSMVKYGAPMVYTRLHITISFAKRDLRGKPCAKSTIMQKW